MTARWRYFHLFSLILAIMVQGMGGFALAREASNPIPASATYRAWEEATSSPMEGNTHTTLTPAFPDKQWWTRFNDPHLNAYLAEGIKNNPGLNASLQRIQQSRAQVADAFSRQLPSLSLNPGFNRIGLPDIPLGGFSLPSTIKIFMLAFQANYELDLFGRNRNITQSARKEQEAVEQDSRAVLLALQGEVASSYFNLLRADALVQSQNERLKLLTRIHALKQNQRQAGLTDYDEVIRADRDVAQALTSLTAYQQQQALFAHQLAVLAGRTPAAQSQLERGSLDKLTLPAETETGLPSELVARRPDILASERRLERAAIDLRVARKAFLPTINLSGMLTMAGSHFKDAFNPDSMVDLEAVRVNQPLFQGGKLSAGIKLQRARQREQIENYRQTILTAFREVEDQLALLRSNYESLNSNAKRYELTEHSLRITENQYQQGLIPRLNLLQAQSELVQYQQLSTQSKADAMIATVNLYKALGGGF